MNLKRISIIRSFYEDNKQSLYAYALSLTGKHADAEDAVHVAISKLLKLNLMPRKLKSFVYRSIRNAAIDAWRKYGSRQGAMPDIGEVPDEERDMSFSEELQELLLKLKADEREIVVLKTVDGMTFKEIAGISGKSSNTVASTYRRSLEKLRKEIEKGEKHERA